MAFLEYDDNNMNDVEYKFISVGGGGKKKRERATSKYNYVKIVTSIKTKTTK